MARIYTTATGLQVDIDAIIIKQQLSQAPMTIDVETRKSFIDSKEIRKRIDIPIETEIESLIVDEIVGTDAKPIIKSKIISKI